MRRSFLRGYAVRHKRMFVILGVVVGLFVILNYAVLPLYVNHGSRLSVPPVVGLPLNEAQRRLDSMALQPVQADVRPDPTHPVGVVIFQNPLPGAIVKEGRRVYLTLSGGEVQVSVPLLRGRSLRDAKFSLERFGLRLGGIGYVNSDIFPENTVIDQAVPADAKVARGTSVGITVSKGKILEATTVPQLVGKPLAEAEKLLLAAGLKIGNITYQPNFELLPNTVVDQYPRVGDPVSLGQGIDLFVVQAGKPSEEIHIPRN